MLAASRAGQQADATLWGRWHYVRCLEESLPESVFGNTDRFSWRFSWHATPVEEGMSVGLDLSREEREFHQVRQGLVLLLPAKR